MLTLTRWPGQVDNLGMGAPVHQPRPQPGEREMYFFLLHRVS